MTGNPLRLAKACTLGMTPSMTLFSLMPQRV